MSRLMGFAGLAATLVALFAHKIGIARSDLWGFGRKFLLGLGLFLLLVYLVITSWKAIQKGLKWLRARTDSLVDRTLHFPVVQKLLAGLRRVSTRWKTTWDYSPLVGWWSAHLRPPLEKVLSRIRRSSVVRYLSASQDRLAALSAVCVGVIVITGYVFYVSVGRWTDWPVTTSDYERLAEAFSHGQVFLLEKPDPALANLADPYDFTQWKGIRVIWDTSYYDGKYYLNWGPAPAFVLMFIHLFTAHPVPDDVLVFIFVTGAFFFSSLLILSLRKRLYPALNWKFVIPALFIAGFANPLPWMLNRPAIYEAAIAGGQFFLLAGFYFAFTALAFQPAVYWKLALASLCWVLAMASRTTLAVAVAFLVPVTCLYLILQPSSKRTWKYILTLGLILGAGFAGLLLYNKVRFDSWFEFGLRYLLSGVDSHKLDIQAWYAGNFLPNFNNYLINPFRTMDIFPYVKANWGGQLAFFYFEAPAHYSGEQVSGLIPTLPFLIFTLISFYYIFRTIWRLAAYWRSSILHAAKPRFVLELKEWISLALGGASILAFLPILFFSSNNMRYLADVVPMLVLLSILGFWQGVEGCTNRPVLRKALIVLMLMLVTYSVLVSLLLAITGNEARFENLNPILFDHLTRWLTP